MLANVQHFHPNPNQLDHLIRGNLLYIPFNLAPLLHYAASKGDSNLCKLLLQHNDKDAKNSDGLTPFHLAASLGHFEVCKILLKVW